MKTKILATVLSVTGVMLSAASAFAESNASVYGEVRIPDVNASMVCPVGGDAYFDVASVYPAGCEILDVSYVDPDEICESCSVPVNTQDCEVSFKSDVSTDSSVEAHIKVLTTDGDMSVLVLNVRPLDIETDTPVYNTMTYLDCSLSDSTVFDVAEFFDESGWVADSVDVVDGASVFVQDPFVDAAGKVVVDLKYDESILDQTATLAVNAVNGDHDAALVNLVVVPDTLTYVEDVVDTSDVLDTDEPNLVTADSVTDVSVDILSDVPVKPNPDTGCSGIAVAGGLLLIGASAVMLFRKKR